MVATILVRRTGRKLLLAAAGTSPTRERAGAPDLVRAWGPSRQDAHRHPPEAADEAPTRAQESEVDVTRAACGHPDGAGRERDRARQIPTNPPWRWMTSPSALSVPPWRRSQIMSQCTALAFVPPVSG